MWFAFLLSWRDWKCWCRLAKIRGNGTGGTGTLDVGFCRSWGRSGDVVRFFVGTRGDVMPGVGICKALEAFFADMVLPGWAFALLQQSFQSCRHLAHWSHKLLGFSSLDHLGICQATVKPELFYRRREAVMAALGLKTPGPRVTWAMKRFHWKGWLATSGNSLATKVRDAILYMDSNWDFNTIWKCVIRQSVVQGLQICGHSATDIVSRFGELTSWWRDIHRTILVMTPWPIDFFSVSCSAQTQTFRICSECCRGRRDFHLDSCPGVSCMPWSSQGADVTILVTKLTYNRQPGHVKEMKKMKEALACYLNIGVIEKSKRWPWRNEKNMSCW